MVRSGGIFWLLGGHFSVALRFLPDTLVLAANASSFVALLRRCEQSLRTDDGWSARTRRSYIFLSSREEASAPGWACVMAKSGLVLGVRNFLFTVRSG